MYQFSDYGHLGVPMFFVISGYVITHSAEASLASNKSPLLFLKSRFLRIYPTFWASILLILAIPYLVEGISSLKTGSFIWPENLMDRFNLSEWINVLLLTKVFFATSNDLALEFNSINAVYWTLAIEFQFYLVVFFALYLGRFFRHAVVLLSVIAILMKFIPDNLNYGLFIHYWPPFSVGIALAYIHKNKIEFRMGSAFSTAQQLAFLVIAICIAGYLSPTQLHTSPFLFATVFGVFLWFFSGLEKYLQRMKRSRNRFIYWLLEPWLIIGAMSYSLYLIHVKLYLIPAMFARQLFSSNSILFSLVTIIGTLLLCYPFYYFVERNFLSKKLKTLHQQVIVTPRF